MLPAELLLGFGGVTQEEFYLRGPEVARVYGYDLSTYRERKVLVMNFGNDTDPLRRPCP